MARWTPRARRPPRRSSMACWSAARTLSVISSISSPGPSPEASSAPATSSSRSGCWSWRTDRLTLRNGWGWSGNRRLQWRAAWAGGVQDPAADGHDQAGVLGQGDELARHDQAPVGMVPADQRLHPGQAAAGQLDHRLVADRELLADDGPAQGRLEVEALHGPGVHGRVEHPDPGPAGRLGRVHGHVGVAQQPLGVLVAAAGQADPTLALASTSAARSARSRASVTWARRLSRVARASSGTSASATAGVVSGSGAASPSSSAVAAAATWWTATRRRRLGNSRPTIAPFR